MKEAKKTEFDYLFQDIFGFLSYKCPHCGKIYQDEGNKEAIADWGECLMCDHLRTNE